ncbi:MAG TPA: hypothetical protein VFY58_09135 [Nocardioides sp.]|nr:hypothetical protein [Nocardioides sp.]
MTRDHGSGSPLAAGLVGLLVTSGYLALWWVLVERATCEQTGMFACSGPAISMYLFGVPTAYVVWSLGLRLVRAPLPWLAPVVVLMALVVLVPTSEVIEPPTWGWPVVAGALTAAWARLLMPVVRSRETEPA